MAPLGLALRLTAALVQLAVALIGLLIKGLVRLWQLATATPQSRKISVVALGALALLAACMVTTANVMRLLGIGVTPVPTINVVAINTGAALTAWAPVTRAAEARVVFDMPSTPTALVTFETPTAEAPIALTLPTNAAAFSAVVLPTNAPAHPLGTSGQCVDKTYTAAAHKQGACSRHDGVLLWWGP